jgi:hypothetical protein
MNLEEVISAWCDNIIINIEREYEAIGRRASGAFGKSMFTDIVQTEKKISVKIEGADYIYWLENGRNKNKDQSDDGLRKWAVGFGLSVIRQWVNDKNIISEDIDSNSLSIAIAYKIARFGYVGKPFISKIINEKSLNELKSSIGNTYMDNIKYDILKYLEDGSK